MKKFVIFILVFAHSFAAAQTVTLNGVVFDKTARIPVVNANVTLTRSSGTQILFHSHTAVNGSYEITGLAPDSYLPKIIHFNNPHLHTHTHTSGEFQ